MTGGLPILSRIFTGPVGPTSVEAGIESPALRSPISASSQKTVRLAVADECERIAELERENAELREQIDAQTALATKTPEVPVAASLPPAGKMPAIAMVAGGLVGVAGVFAMNVLAMLAGIL